VGIEIRHSACLVSDIGTQMSFKVDGVDKMLWGTVGSRTPNGPNLYELDVADLEIKIFCSVA
jgi:hypothetical protein